MIRLVFTAYLLLLVPASKVRAATGSATTSDVAVVTRTVSLTLAGLSSSSGTLSPAFASGTVAYSLNAGASGSITLTPTVSDAAATVRVNGALAASGSPSAAIPLVLGSNNTITTVVTAQNSTRSQTYTLTATRVAGLTQAINFFATIGDRLLTAPNVTLSGTSSSGLAVTYTVVSGPAMLSGTTLTLTGEGSVTVNCATTIKTTP